MGGKSPHSITHTLLHLWDKTLSKKRCANAKAKKKEKQGTAVTTDDGASTMLINYAVIPAAMSETAIGSELEEQVVPLSKAKVLGSCLSAAVEAMSQGIWHKI